jgi:hypothetical protein
MTNTENLPANITNFPAPTEINMIQTLARNAQLSGLYSGVGNESKIFMILMAARELGISPMVALNGGIHNINGKIEVSARMMNSMIRRSGHSLIIETEAKKCTITARRKDSHEEHIEEFTWEMAERAGLVKGNNWQKYPEDMLFARCMSRVARKIFPDVIATSYVEGEISGKEPDPELQPSPYEDVTTYQNDIHNDTNNLPKSTELVSNPPPPKKDLVLNQDQIDTLASYLPRITQKCKYNFFDFFGIKDATELHKIPADKYKGTINSFDLNIATQTSLPV